MVVIQNIIRIQHKGGRARMTVKEMDRVWINVYCLEKAIKAVYVE